jgi:acyl dehydratase
MTTQVRFIDVDIDTPLPRQVTVVDPVQMFFFSAATYNAHRIHYDRPWAVDVEGFPGIVVHGPLQVALIAKMVTDWIGGGGRLITLTVQNRASAFSSEELVCSGRVVGLSREHGMGLVDVEVRCETGARVLVTGSARVCLPDAAAPADAESPNRDDLC